VSEHRAKTHIQHVHLKAIAVLASRSESDSRRRHPAVAHVPVAAVAHLAMAVRLLAQRERFPFVVTMPLWVNEFRDGAIQRRIDYLNACNVDADPWPRHFLPNFGDGLRHFEAWNTTHRHDIGISRRHCHAPPPRKQCALHFGTQQPVPAYLHQ
jgi:hypothetical protein